MRYLIILLALLLVPFTSVTSSAAQIRLFVAEMSATGAGVQNRDEMKLTLQTLLASRLNGDRILAVGSAAEADVVVRGTYVTIGKIFSVDAIARSAAGKTMTRVFVQGESQDELIPAIGKLADKLTAELIRVYDATPELPGAALLPTPTAAATSKSDIVRNEQLLTALAGEIIKPRNTEPVSAAGNWLSKRLNGAANLLATGKILPDGSREIFLAEGVRLAYYRQQGIDMKLLAEAELSPEDKIISLDTIEGGDGNLDIYVTIIRFGEPSSQVWQVKGEKLILVSEKLPYFFRSAGLAGGVKKLYAQSMGRNDDFYGDVAEATRSGSSITLKNPLEMPRYGSIYNFNQFRDRDGKTFTVVINSDGYLVVYDQQLKELWRSNDKFGGSELYFQREDLANARVTGDSNRWIFMNLRIQVSSRGEILVGKNDGFWVLGNSRSYKRGAVYCLTWNGSSLEEKWRTRETQNYMPAYLFDDTRDELLVLQTIQRAGFVTRGASVLSIKKVE